MPDDICCARESCAADNLCQLLRTSCLSRVLVIRCTHVFMFPCFKRLFVDDALIPQSLHLTVGSVGEETRKNQFQLYQVGLGVETCHRAQQFELRRIERLSDSCFHNRIFSFFSTRKDTIFSRMASSLQKYFGRSDRKSRNWYPYHSGRAESQRIAQSDYRDRRGADLFPDRYSLPSGIYQREGCLEQGLHKRFHKRLHKRKSSASV